MTYKHILLWIPSLTFLISCGDNPQTANPEVPKAPVEKISTQAKSYPYYTETTEGPCPANSLMSNAKFDVIKGDIYVRTSPAEASERVINQKATSVLGSTQFVDIGSMTGVTELCRIGDWSYVKANEPDYLRESHQGWVLSNKLKPEVISDGLKQFPESAFYFGKSEQPHKNTIMRGVQMVQRDNPKCQGTIDPGSASLSPTRGSPKDPVFFVACESNGIPFNIWFSKSDVDNDKPIKALANLPKSEAVSRCERWVKTQANHPSTVDFSRFLDLAIDETPNGNTRVNTTFKAKNSFGTELEFEVSCLVNSDGLMEGKIAEKTL